MGGASSEQPQRKTYDQLAVERAEKIQRLREKKELERRTEELSAALNEGSGGRDEEGEREQWIAMLQLNLYRSQEFAKSIDDEIPILRHIEAVRKGEGPPVAKRPGASGHGPPRQPAKPLVITREMLRVRLTTCDSFSNVFQLVSKLSTVKSFQLYSQTFSTFSLAFITSSSPFAPPPLSPFIQGEVFGAGYPSLPTMTVEEFYQQRYGGGGGEGSGQEESGGPGKEGEEEKEEEDEDSEEALKKAREWDEFKDGLWSILMW